MRPLDRLDALLIAVALTLATLTMAALDLVGEAVRTGVLP